MWQSRLFWKLFLVMAGLNLALLAGFLTVAAGWQEEQVWEQVERRLEDAAYLLRSQVGDRLSIGSRDHLQPLLKKLSTETGIRLTVVAADGTVLGDSEKDPVRMENHSDRPELQQAVAEGLGKSTRISPTLKITMFYVAVPIQSPIHDNREVAALARVAMDVQTIEDQIAATRRLLWLLASIGAAVAVMVSYAVALSLVRPIHQLTLAARAMAAGDHRHPVTLERRDEIGSLGRAFHVMQQALDSQFAQLAENNQRLATVLEGMNEGVIAVDADEQIVLANDASQKQFGLEAAGIIGRPIREVFRWHPLHDAVAAARSQDEPYRSEAELPGPNRRRLGVWAGRLPGEPSPGVLIVLHDVTELRRLETMRRDFVANVSHELKTPLAGIKACAETLRLGAIDDADHNLEFVRRIEEQAERLHALILDLLALARVEAGEKALELCDVSLAEMIAARLENCAGVAAKRNIHLRAEAIDSSLVIRTDEESLATILDNLLDNAIKYTSDGGEVIVRYGTENGYCTIEVSDNGIGIAPQDQERIFERFYRVDKARSRDLGGTGLGLAIVKHLAQALGGDVHLTSRLGQGSCFVVRLPQV